MANYLYGGVELPELPKWDTKTYPYAVISRFGVISSQYKYWLRVFKEPYTMSSETISTYSFFNVPVGDVYLSCSCDYNSPTEWSELDETVAENENGDVAVVLTGTKIIWSTFDIMAGGTVVFEKNGELPETEDETPETTPLYYCKNGVWRRLFRKVNGAWEEVDGVFGLTPEVRELKELHDSLGVVEPFIYFTDPHLCEGVGWEPRFHEYMAKVKQAYDNSPCKLVICGGDWIGNSDTKEEATYKLSYVADYMHRLFGNNHMLVLGNHDTNYQGTEQLTQQELIDLWYKDTNTGKAYFYYDTQTTRFLVLDTQTDWNPEWSEYFQEQRDWLAANLSAELKNVVVAHIDWVDSDLTTRTSLVDAIQYVDGVDMVLAGHIHADHVNYGVVPEVVTTNLQAGGVPTFDLCLLDVENNQLHMIRVGTGENRVIELGGAT